MQARLLAHWKFDEVAGELIAEASGNASLQLCAEVPRVGGVHGNALSLSGAHRLRLPPIANSNRMAEISFSAWVRPVDLSGYREIYRQECAERLLFSFQNNGTILSLGLNIGGYVECDAAIQPAQLLDGAWHHVAATFDGRVMRVYLDGREIRHLDRPGTISTNPTAPAFIGSSSGSGEHFQGSLDELQIHQHALSADQIAQLYQQGTADLASRLAQYEQQLTGLYQRQDTFAQSMAHFRHVLSNHKLGRDREFLGILLARLRADFPDDCARYMQVTGSSPMEYLTATSTNRWSNWCSTTSK